MSEHSSLTRLTTQRPIAVLMVFVAALVFGYFSYALLPLTLMPELTYPTLTVRTEYPGAAPEEVENDISRPIEESLGIIGGLSRISSISRPGVSDVVLEFHWDTDMSDAAQDALEKLDLVFLPEEAERPRILHYDPALDPILELSLSASDEDGDAAGGLRRLRRLADLQVKRLLEPVKGVAAVRVRGGLEEEIHVLLEEDALRRTGVSIQQVIDRLRDENINVAGGNITEGRTEYMVRTLNEFEDLSQIADTIVTRFEDRDVRVRDLGQVVASHKEREIVTRTDGGDSVQLEIYKEGDANIVAVAQRIKALVGNVPDEDAAAGDDDDDGPRTPTTLAGLLKQSEGVELKVVADRSLFIESSIREVRNTALVGGLLAIAVLFLFLRNARTTFIVAVSIPMSLLVTFAPLNLVGVSLNIMSLGGLALGIGMLVDSSIVVLESIFRCREEGDDVVQAAVRGTEEVRAAVFVSTLTTIAVFLPMVFVEGIAGQAFGDLGLAVVMSLLASLAVALFFIPMLASRPPFRLGPGARFEPKSLARFSTPADCLQIWRSSSRWARAPLALYLPLRLVVGLLFELVGKIVLLVVALLLAVVTPLVAGLGKLLGWLLAVPLQATSRALDVLQRGYRPLLSWSLRHPSAIALLVGACLVVGVQAGRGLNAELLPEVRQGEFTFEVALPVGTPLDHTERTLEAVERAVVAEESGIEALIVTFGYDAANTQRSDEGEHTARFKILLNDTARATGAEDALVDRLRERLASIPDLEARLVRPVLFSSKTPIEVEVHGDDLVALRRQAEIVTAELSDLPDLADVETTLRSGAPEVQIVYDRDQLSRHGLNIGQVARLVRDKVKGFEATRLNLKDRRVPIVVRLEGDDRQTVEDVRTLTINPAAERPLPLAAVAEVSLGEGPSEVRRVDGRRVALVRANIAEGSLSSATAAIQRTLRRDVDWPSDMTFIIGGQNEEWERSRSSLFLAMALSVFLVYVIMAAQFESLTHPLVILFTIPLAFFGSVMALRLLSVNVSIVVFLGMILLAGIVVNNAIVLVDYINTLRRRGLTRDRAIVEAGSVRLRPILMTTATTVLGLFPMALGLGDGAEIRTPMALTVISGLAVSTLLTLVVIPVTYRTIDRLKDLLLGRREEIDSETSPDVADAGTEVVTP